MDEKQLQFLYSEYAKNKGFKDYSEFKGLMSSEGSRKLFFDDANKELGFKDYNEFNDLLGLKKKEQEVLPSVSSPSKSQLVLPDFEKGRAFAEKGFLMQGEGTKAPKPEKRISFEPSFNIAAPFQVKVLEEGEEPSFASDLMTAGARGQIQGKVANLLPAGKVPTNEELGEIAQLQSDAKLLPQSKAEKAYQEKGLKGLFSESPLLGAQFIGETMLSSLSSLVEAGTRTLPTAIAAGAGAGAAFGGIGALPGAAMGLLAGQSAAGYNLSTSQDILNSLSENGVDISNKESLIKAFSDENKMTKIRTTAAKYGVPILLFDAATAGLAGKLAAGAIGKSLSRKLLAGLGEAGIQMTGGAGGELAGQIASGKKVNWDDVAVEAIAEVPGGAVEVTAGIALERSKTSSNNNTLATQIAIQGPEDGVKDAVLNLNRDLANNVITPEQHQEGMAFVEKASQVSTKIPETVTGESKAKSIELLVERNDIKEGNQILEQQKQATDEAYHAGIDEEIKANEEKIKKIDSEVYNIAKNPIPVKERPVVEILEQEIIEPKTTEVKPTEAKRIVEPPKPISEMNSEELSDFATETRRALKKQDKEFEGKTEKEKEDLGYYDIIFEVEDLRDASERINFIENAENVNDLANSVKSILSNIRGNEPDEYQLAILNAAKNKSIELGIESKDLIKKIGYKIANQYKDVEDAELMVKSALEKLMPKATSQEVKPTKAKTVEQLRAEEQAEYDSMTDPNDEVKKKEIYDKYDKLITPLLEKQEVKPTEVKQPTKEVEEGRTKGVKPLSEFKVGDKFVFATDRDGTERIIVSIKNGIVEFKSKGSKEVSSASQIQRLGNDLALLKSDWDKGIRPNESEFEGSRFKSKVKPTKEQIDNLTKELLRVNYMDDDLEAKSEGTPGKVGYVQSAEDSYREIAKRYLENDLDIVEVVDEFHGGKDRLQKIINGKSKATEVKTKEQEAPKKTYQEALREKQEAEKKVNRQVGAEKAAITKELKKEANKIEVSDARSAVLNYLSGANLSEQAINEVSGRVKRARLNTGERELKSEEARARDYVAKKGEGESLDEAAHSIWDNLSEEMQSKMDTQEVKEALMQAIMENKTKAEALKSLIDGYKEESLEDQEAEFYRRYNITEDEIEAELALAEESLEFDGSDEYDFDLPEEYINNLIEQYEAENEGKIEQPTQRVKEEGTKKVSAGEISEQKKLEKSYKDLTNIEKRQIINSKFEELLKELKIEKICPTD
jgi:hypothetical protein